LGQLWRLYQQHRLKLLTTNRQRRARDCAGYFLEHLGDRFAIENLSQSHVDTYAVARKSGELGDQRRDVKIRGVRDGTVRNDLTWLASLFNFGRGFKVNGRPLLAANPMQGLTLPRELNIRRPIASDERYRLTLAKADEADPTGRLACLLALARYTGRRITAICELRASDVLLSPDTIARVLAATGQDSALARHMPHGAIRWRPESDKQGYEDVSPISAPAKAAIERYLRAHPRVGDVWMFPQPKHRDRPINESLARILRIRAEELAGLPRIERGGFHSYRRAYASDRKHLPDVDVARSAGWRDLATMKRSYQQPDPVTTLRVIENEAPEKGERIERAEKSTG
jgi:integrase